MNLENLWSNPKNVDINTRFIYFISITDDNGNEFRYIGKARDKSRLNEYRNNMLKINNGKERGAKQNYRAIHFALYTAIENNWIIKFHPLVNCTMEEVDKIEQSKIKELKCNLNGAKTWRIPQIPSLTISALLR